MNEPIVSNMDIAAWKAQQERNRTARRRQLYSPGDLWKQQQQALGELAKLRPELPRKPKVA